MILANLKQPAQRVSLLQAVRLGLGAGQGLFMPVQWPRLPADGLLEMDFVTRSAAIWQALAGDELSAAEIDVMLRTAFSFPVPLVPVSENTACLELFHGPTLAFKDFGARVMAGALALAQARADVARTTIVTATSGDTGAAVARAFHGKPGVQVVVLYPEGRIPLLQERLFSTLDGNVRCLAVAGDFDACQALVKQCFDDLPLVAALNINSANSINISRILAQVCYYFEAFAQLDDRQRQAAVFAVPSGNFGNLCAAAIAKVIGLPVKRLLAATNRNDTVPRYWQTDVWQPRPTEATYSNAMDVSAPNNWPRIQHLLDTGLLARRDLHAVAVSEEATIRGLRALNGLGYLSEPHAALAWQALQSDLQPGEYGVFLGTAHPAKFKQAVESLLGCDVAVPDTLALAAARPPRNGRIAADYAALKAELLAFAG